MTRHLKSLHNRVESSHRAIIDTRYHLRLDGWDGCVKELIDGEGTAGGAGEAG